MLLGKRSLETNSVRRYDVEFCDFLREGSHVVTATVSSSSLTTTAVTSLSPDQKTVHVTVTSGAVAETLTLSLQTTDSLGQVINDKIEIVVVT